MTFVWQISNLLANEASLDEYLRKNGPLYNKDSFNPQKRKKERKNARKKERKKERKK